MVPRVGAQEDRVSGRLGCCARGGGEVSKLLILGGGVLRGAVQSQRGCHGK